MPSRSPCLRARQADLCAEKTKNFQQSWKAIANLMQGYRLISGDPINSYTSCNTMPACLPASVPRSCQSCETHRRHSTAALVMSEAAVPGAPSESWAPGLPGRSITSSCIYEPLVSTLETPRLHQTPCHSPACPPCGCRFHIPAPKLRGIWRFLRAEMQHAHEGTPAEQGGQSLRDGPSAHNSSATYADSD